MSWSRYHALWLPDRCVFYAGLLPGVVSSQAPPGAGGSFNTGFVIAGSGANVNDGGNVAWSNPDRITADDASNAAANVSTIGWATQILVSGSHNLASIPDTATIDGIIVRVQRLKQSTISVTADHTVALTKNGTTFPGGNRAKSADWETTATNIDYGDPGDLWGLSWTPAEIKASTFGVGFKSRSVSGTAGANNHRVDAVWIDVYYTD